jgi:hypothetical protein
LTSPWPCSLTTKLQQVTEGNKSKTTNNKQKGEGEKENKNVKDKIRAVSLL